MDARYANVASIIILAACIVLLVSVKFLGPNNEVELAAENIIAQELKG